MRSRTGSLGEALGWAAAVTAIEAIARRRFRSRSRAWLVAYAIVGAAGSAAVLARRDEPPAKPSPRGRRAALVSGLALAAGGYQVGRAALRDRPTDPPREGFWLETSALAGAVAPAEEVIWGALVQPAAGLVGTSALFAAKHVVVDGRWRRALGLGLFGLGLGLLRTRSRTLALLTHVACNATGVALGHVTGREQF